MLLEARATIYPTEIVIDYSATNPGRKTAYLQHLMMDVEGGDGGSPSGCIFHGFKPAVRIFHHGPGTALLFAGTLEPPPGTNLAWPGTPGATRLKPGQKTQASLTLALPLLEQDPWFAEPEPFDEVRVTKLLLRIDYILGKTGILSGMFSGLSVEEYDGYPGVYQVSGAPVAQAETSIVLAQPVMLRRLRKDLQRST